MAKPKPKATPKAMRRSPPRSKPSRKPNNSLEALQDELKARRALRPAGTGPDTGSR